MCVMSFPAQVLYSYSIGFVYILTGLLCVGGLGPAVAFCSEVRTCYKHHMEDEFPTHPDIILHFSDVCNNLSKKYTGFSTESQ